jgi:hypothetical protein
MSLAGSPDDRYIFTPYDIPEGTQRGAAYLGGWYWITSSASDEIMIVDPSGALVATAYTELLPGRCGAPPQQFIAWQDNNTMLLVADNQIDWVAVGW